LYEPIRTVFGTAPGFIRENSARGVVNVTVSRDAVSLRTGAGVVTVAALTPVSGAVVADAAFVAREMVSLATRGVATTLSFAEVTGAFDEKRRGVRTMTSAISASASSVRLSMQVVELP
jgi:hypothetical protein